MKNLNEEYRKKIGELRDSMFDMFEGQNHQIVLASLISTIVIMADGQDDPRKALKDLCRALLESQEKYFEFKENDNEKI